MDGVAENCSSAIAPALPYYRPSMDILHFPHFPHLTSMDGVAENCSSAIAPALPYYRPSMDILYFPHFPRHEGHLLRIVSCDSSTCFLLSAFYFFAPISNARCLDAFASNASLPASQLGMVSGQPNMWAVSTSHSAFIWSSLAFKQLM